MKKYEPQNGFTIIELLVTVVILGILTALGGYAYIQQKNKTYFMDSLEEARKSFGFLVKKRMANLGRCMPNGTKTTNGSKYFSSLSYKNPAPATCSITLTYNTSSSTPEVFHSKKLGLVYQFTQRKGIDETCITTVSSDSYSSRVCGLGVPP